MNMMDSRKFRRKRKPLGSAPLAEPSAGQGGRQSGTGAGPEEDLTPVAPLASRQERLAQRAAAEAAQQEAALQEAARQEAARQEAARQEAARQDAARQEAERQGAARRAEIDAARRAQVAAEEQARAQAAAEAKRRAEEQARAQAAAEAKRRAEEQARAQAAAEAQRRAEKQARAQAAAEAQRRAEEQARAQAAAEAKRQAEERAKAKAAARVAARAKRIEAARKAEEDRLRKQALAAQAQTLNDQEIARRTQPPLTLPPEARAELPPEPTPAPEPETPPRDPWQDLGALSVDLGHLNRNRIITADRLDPAHTTFDVLRTRLMHALNERGWKRVAITSPGKDCGKTFTTTNLAISLSRQENTRTLVMDFDMRRPSMHTVMGGASPGALGDVLRGTLDPEDHLLRMGPNTFDAGRNIAFALNTVVEPYASELLQDPRTDRALKHLEESFAPDVMLFDLPPALFYDDVIAFRPQYDGVLLVIGGGLTTEREIKDVERRLGADTPLLGMVLNKAEGTAVERYTY